MNTSNIIRANTRTPHAASAYSIKSRMRQVRRALTQVFAEPVVGNPLHEAWTADGEPLERVPPAEQAKSCASRHLVVPHSRGR